MDVPPLRSDQRGFCNRRGVARGLLLRLIFMMITINVSLRKTEMKRQFLYANPTCILPFASMCKDKAEVYAGTHGAVQSVGVDGKHPVGLEGEA